jgi:hypothetical protein
MPDCKHVTLFGVSPFLLSNKLDPAVHPTLTLLLRVFIVQISLPYASAGTVKVYRFNSDFF